MSQRQTLQGRYRITAISLALIIFCFGCTNSADTGEEIGLGEMPATSGDIVISTGASEVASETVPTEDSSMQDDTPSTSNPSSSQELSTGVEKASVGSQKSSGDDAASSNIWDSVTCAYPEELLKRPTEYIVPEYGDGIQEVLYISGEINVPEGVYPGDYSQAVSADFNPVFVARRTKPRDMLEHSELYLVFRNTAGYYIDRAPIETVPPLNPHHHPDSPIDYSDYSPFYFRSEILIDPWITDILDYYTIELVDGSQIDDFGEPRVIDSIDRSIHLPHVEITQPILGERMTDSSLLLSWNATDIDGDELKYRIWYSKNNGYSYDLLEDNLDSPSFELNRLDAFFERFESPRARFAVSASDGVRSIFVESGTFCVPRINPRFHELNVDATEQQSLGVINNDQNVVLSVTGDSEEAYVYKSILFDWHSDLVGFLGESASIFLSPTVLGSGYHTITATGKTANEKIITGSATIRVNGETIPQDTDLVDMSLFASWDNLACAYTDNYNRSSRVLSWTYPQIYYITGSINLPEGGKWGEWDKAISVDFDPVFSVIAGSMKPRNLLEDNKLFLEFSDAEGQVLRTVPVETARRFGSEHPRLESEYFGPFTFRSEFLNEPSANDISQEYHTIGLLDYSQPASPRLIDSISRSDNMPTAAIVQPTSGQSLTGNTLLLEWNASDADGDKLTYRTWYSANNGAAYQLLDYNLDSTSRELSRLDGFFEQFESNAARLGVSVSDGAQSVFIESDTFCVPRIVPQFHELDVDTPEMQLSRVINRDQTIVLSVTGDATEANEDNSILLEWHSDIDGYLGIGSSLFLSPVTLRSGIHTITAIGQTSAGTEVTVSATINVYKN